MPEFGCTWVWDNTEGHWILQSCTCSAGNACPVPASRFVEESCDTEEEASPSKDAPLPDRYTRLDGGGRCFKRTHDEFKAWVMTHVADRPVPPSPNPMDIVKTECKPAPAILANCPEDP